MNRTNVQLLRDTLAKHYLAEEGIKHKSGRVGFNMYRVQTTGIADRLDECATVCCLAGWSRIISGDSADLDDQSTTSAIDWLGLRREDGRELFMPMFYSGNGIDWSTITVPEALLVLDHLLATGEVDWSIILRRREKLRTNGYVPASPVYGRSETVAP